MQCSVFDNAKLSSDAKQLIPTGDLAIGGKTPLHLFSPAGKLIILKSVPRNYFSSYPQTIDRNAFHKNMYHILGVVYYSCVRSCITEEMNESFV